MGFLQVGAVVAQVCVGGGGRAGCSCSAERPDGSQGRSGNSGNSNDENPRRAFIEQADILGILGAATISIQKGLEDTLAENTPCSHGTWNKCSK